MDGDVDRPSDAVVQILLEVWQEVLDHDGVGSDDDFYLVGGDSILAIRAVALARERGVGLSVADLLDAGTIRALATHILAGSGEPAATYRPFALLSPADRELTGAHIVDAYPMTALQLGMLYHSEGADPDTYHNVTSVVVRRAFDEARLRRCLASLARRHEALRTSFDVEHFSVPVALVHDEVAPELSVADLRTESDAGRPVAAMLAAERARRVTWRQPPAIRFRADVLSGDSFRLTWANHHALLDGWSSSVLCTELVTAYVEAEPLESPAVPAFGAYVALELHAGGSAADADFWSRYLAGAAPARLPRPHPAASAAPRPRETVAVPVPAETTTRLHQIARGTSVPLKALLMAVHAVALGRWNPAAAEVVVGQVGHGRPELPGAESTLGLFLTTLPVRIPLHPAPADAGVAAENVAQPGLTWLDVARTVIAAERSGHPHRWLPTVDIQAAGGGLVVENAFSYTDYHVIDELIQRRLIEPDTMYNDVHTSYALLVEVAVDPAGDQLHVLFQFRPDRWSPDQARQHIDSFLDCLEALRSDPRSLCWTVSATPGPELAGGAETTPPATTVVDLFQAQVAIAPDRIAVATPDGSLTYGDLAARANVLAQALGAAGVRSQSRVGVLLPRSSDLLVATMAVLYAGAALMPLDPEHPHRRNAQILADAGADVLLGSTDMVGTDYPCPILDLTSVDWAAAAPPPPAATPGSDDLAYILYTSGSTGQPKGVGVEHRQLAAFARAFIDRIGLGADHVMLAWTTTSFDISFVEILLPLLVGARIELVGDRDSHDPVRVRDRIAAAGVTIVQATATKLRVLLEVGWPGPMTVVNAGETLPRAVAQDLADAGCVVWNAYGPTEATIYATVHLFEPSDPGPVPSARHWPV